MGSIATTDARALFTKKVIDVYKERPMPASFLRSFFPEKVSATKYVSVEVQRGTEKVSADVVRGTEGTRNKFGLSTEKIFEPPYYREYFELTELDLYDRLIGSETIDASVFAQLAEEAAEKLATIQDKIKRREELQCSQVLETGIVTYTHGTNVDFKRKAGSLVDNSGTPWDGANDPIPQIQAGCNFLRQKGKSQGAVINMICGSDALSALFNNSDFTSKADVRRIDQVAIRMPQRDSVGGTTHGEFSAGDYIIRVWSYPEYYDDSAGTSTAYLNSKKVILLPEAPRFQMAFAGVPQLLTPGQAPSRGAYHFGEYIDQRKKSHVMDVESAFLAVPVAVDQIYTMQVLA